MIDHNKEYSSKDLKKLNFHGSRIYTITFGRKKISSICLYIEYIIKAIRKPDNYYKFIINKGKLEFIGVSNLIINLDFDEFSTTTLEIDEIIMKKIKNKNHFIIEIFTGTNSGVISFDADDFSLKF